MKIEIEFPLHNIDSGNELPRSLRLGPNITILNITILLYIYI